MTPISQKYMTAWALRHPIIRPDYLCYSATVDTVDCIHCAYIRYTLNSYSRNISLV